MIKGKNLKTIRKELGDYGVVMTNAQFEGLTYQDLKTLYKKAYKVAMLKDDIFDIMEKADPKPPVKTK